MYGKRLPTDESGTHESWPFHSLVGPISRTAAKEVADAVTVVDAGLPRAVHIVVERVAGADRTDAWPVRAIAVGSFPSLIARMAASPVVRICRSARER